MATKSNRTNTAAHDAQVIVGINKDLQTVASLPLNGETYTPKSLAALVQSRIDAANAVAAARANWLAATQQYEAINTKLTPVVSGLKQYVLNAFGKTSTLLADFGFTAPKKATLTPEEKQAAVAKRAATRAARNTTGPKAKLAVTGETVRIAALEANQQPPAGSPATTGATGAATAPPTGPAPQAATTQATAPAPSANGNGATPAAGTTSGSKS